MASPVVLDYPMPPDALIAQLATHLPYSLPLLRRLQFARHVDGGITSNAHVLLSYDASTSEGCPDAERIDGGTVVPGKECHFAAAYLDFSRGPETEMWLYSTMEDDDKELDERHAAVDQVIALIGATNGIAAHWKGHRAYPGAVKVGSLAEKIRKILVQHGVRVRVSNQYRKWLFRNHELPIGLGTGALPEGMEWKRVKRENIPLILSRTNIPRQESTLMSLPSLAIVSRDRTPISWAFLGPDGGLSSLHCEEPYRGNGFAKILAAKLFHDSLGDFGDDGWGAADVSEDNFRSQGVCKSLNGKPAWLVSWTLIELSNSNN